MSGAEPLVLAALAGGTALEYSAQRQAAKERRSILNQSFRDTQKATDQAAQLVTKEGEKYGAGRAQDLQSQEDLAYAQSQRDLQGAGAGGDIIGTAGDAGAVSGDFVRAKADKALSEGTRMTAIARELAKVRAPGRMQNEEALRRAEVGQQAGSIFGTARNMAGAAELDAQNVQEPWWGTVGKLAKTAALAYATGGAGGGASSFTQWGGGNQWAADAANVYG